MKKQMLQALRSHAIGNLNLHKTNIDVYFANPAGIGEHSDIMEAVQAELDKMAIHEDRLSMLRFWEEESEQESG
jgi:diacylglycerol kinase family enzyme